jgi:hypothetical protein
MSGFPSRDCAAKTKIQSPFSAVRRIAGLQIPSDNSPSSTQAVVPASCIT